MPQKPQEFDPNEFAAPEFDPNEFAEPTKSTFDPETASDLERQVLGLPPKPTGYTSLWDTAASYIPDPVKSTWKSIWEPTTDITSRAGKAVSDYLDPTQYGTYDPRRYLAAYPEAVGNVLTGLTSPGNLALTAATGGAALAGRTGVQAALPVVAPKVAQGLTTAGRAIGGATAAHGAQTIADPRTTMVEKAFGGLEAVGGGLAARAPKPRGIPAAIPEELPVPQRAAPIEAPVAQPPITGPVVPGSQAAVNLVDELDAAKAEGLTVMPADSPAANYAAKQGYEAVRTLSDGSIAFNVKKPTAAPITPAQEFAQSVEGIKPPPMNNLANATPETLGELNKFMDEGVPPMTPEEAAAGLAQPPTTDVKAFLQSMKQGEAPPVPQQEFNPATLEFIDPKTGEVIPATAAKPGDIPLPVTQTPTVMPGRRAGGRMGAPNMGLPERPMVPPSYRAMEEAVEELRAQGLDDGQIITQHPELDAYIAENPNVAPQAALSTVGRSVPPEVKGQVGGATPPSTAADTPRLPKDLQGAKPRFNVGADSYLPQFQDDLDKALYIISQKKPSVRDADYLKFVMEQTGLNEQQARNLGNQVRSVIKQAVAGKETGNINIPPVARASKQLAGGGGGKPPVKPPVTTGGEPPVPPGGPKQTPKEYLEGKPQISTGEIVPENVRPAAEVTASLAQRLQKAVDEAGTPNAVAAEDISALMDEAAQVINQMPNGPEKSGMVRQILGANKALLTSWDLSAPGRQGKAFITNKAWWTSLDDMVRAWGSKTAADNIAQSIVDHPSGYFTKPVSEAGKVGKSFAEKVGLDLTATEEVFESVIQRAAGKIPLVERSSRAHTAFLNKLRSDQFVSMMESAKKAGMNPESNLELAKAYAKFINDATGRGSVNIGKWKLERNTGVLNDIFFAPKNMAGQIRTWNGILNPVKYYNYDPVMRKQALQSLFAVAGLGLGVGEMARLAGAKVSNDPYSSDFRKIKVGDTRIDLFGGYQQFPVAAMKFIMGKHTPTTGENAGITQDLTKGRMGQNRESVAERFFTNRLSPAGSFIWSWMRGREFDGKPFEWKRAVYERVFPIAAKDLVELAQEDPALAAAWAVPTLTGLTGAQVYSER